MIPDFEQQLNGKMEQASLKELMPDFDKELEWQQLEHRLRPAKVRRLVPLWSYAAAIVLLLVGGICFMKHVPGTGDKQETASHNGEYRTLVPEPDKNETNNPTTNDIVNGTPAVAVSDKQLPPIKGDGSRALKKGYDHSMVINYTAKDYICNNTPCPLQICISQMVQCPNVQPKPVSTCSTLEPDQSGQLHYRAHDSIAKTCSLTVKEIEITSIATGETILLNENSSTTAQDVFNYITGKKKGDVLAGMFTSDCNHQKKKHGVRLNNKYGDLIIQ